MRARAAAWLFALWAAAMLAAPGGAWAHATLVSSNPADGAVVAASPGRVVLTFNEPVGPLSLRLTNPVGETTALTDVVSPGGGRLVVALPELGQGTHVLSYRVVSADGHPVGGALLFSVGHPTAAQAAEAEPIDPLMRALVLVTRGLIYAGLFFGVGGCFFRVWIARSPLPAAARGVVRAAILACLAAAVISVGLQGLDALDLPVSFFFQSDVWAAGMTTSYGITAALVILAFLIAPVTDTRVERPSTKARALAAFAGIGLALAASGHASAADPQWLTRPMVFVHVLGVAFWAGALISLGALLREDGAEARAALLRFSRAIPLVLVTLALAGAVLAVVQIEDISALPTTDYGLVFTFKMIATIVLLVLAAFNRYVLTPMVVAAPPEGRRQLRLAVFAEVAIVIVILALVALWRFTPPPRALAAQNMTPAMVHIHAEKAMADIWITPGRAGPVEASVSLLDHDFAALEAKEVTLEFSSPEVGVEPFTRPARKTADGRWVVDNLIIPAPGRWKVRIDILVNDFEKVSADADMQFRP